MNTEQLALQKDFASLNPAERALVLAEMPQEEFEQLRKLLLTTQRMDSGVEPPAHLRAGLMAKFSEQSKPSGIRRLITARIPIWQAAAALMLGIAVVSLMKKEVVVEKTVTAWQLRVDTVFQEKTLWRERLIVKNRVVFQEKLPAPPMAFSSEKVDTQSFTPNFQPGELSDTHIGTSLGDTPELMDFFTQGDR